MMMTNSDFPAFPATDTINPISGERHEPIYTGMTKREYFAGLGMQGILSNSGFTYDSKWVSEKSIVYANALLSELAKEETV